MDYANTIFIIRNEEEFNYLKNIIPGFKDSRMKSDLFLRRGNSENPNCIRVGNSGVYNGYCDLNFYKDRYDYRLYKIIETSELLKPNLLDLILEEGDQNDTN